MRTTTPILLGLLIALSTVTAIGAVAVMKAYTPGASLSQAHLQNRPDSKRPTSSQPQYETLNLPRQAQNDQNHGDPFGLLRVLKTTARATTSK